MSAKGGSRMLTTVLFQKNLATGRRAFLASLLLLMPVLLSAYTAPMHSSAFQTEQSAKLVSELQAMSLETGGRKRLFYIGLALFQRSGLKTTLQTSPANCGKSRTST
jgi:hypothetical protein